MNAAIPEPTPSFASTEPGTSEDVWAAALPSRPSLSLPRGRGRVLVVAPHPDDEVLACGGLLRLLHDRGWTIEVVSVTDGEAAYPGSEHLAATRRAELATALDRLGVDAEIRHLGLPDGGIAEQEAVLAASLVGEVAAARLVLAPFAGDGHPDHDATGRAVAEACDRARQGSDGGPTTLGYPVWAWHWSRPDAAWFATTRVLPLTPTVRAAKQRAVSAFVSQFDGALGPPILPPWVLARFSRRYETYLEAIKVPAGPS